MQGALPFLEALFHDLEQRGVRWPGHWDIDHICYRVSTLERYRELRDVLSRTEFLLTETPVNGRPISTFRFRQPIEFRGGRIDLLELPAPKTGVQTPEGFEHIEIVADFPFPEITEVAQAFSSKFEVARGAQGLPKVFNSELKLELGDRNLKFHHLSLASVIRLEENVLVYTALMDSKILEDFRDCAPLIAGTFPLGMETTASDLDILLQAKDLPALEEKLRARFESADQFGIVHTEVDGLPTLIANFRHFDVPFEIFAQDRPPVSQRAYQHFLIEEKLLKYGGDALRNRVRNARAKGLKTELAFGQALGLQRDPYEELLDWQKLDIQDLRARLALKP